MPRRSDNRRRMLRFESLECRQLLASISGPDAAGVITVEGTPGSDRISVKSISELWTNKIRHNSVLIEIEDDQTGRLLVSSQIATDGLPNIRIEIDAGAGDDVVHNFSEYRCRIEGGTGDDWLYSGSLGEELFGGPGHDHLFGEGGLDDLYGGPGRDLLFGGDEGARYHNLESQDIVFGYESAFPRTNNYGTSLTRMSNLILINGDDSDNRITIDQPWWGQVIVKVSNLFGSAKCEWQLDVTPDTVLMVRGLDGNDEIVNRSNLKAFLYGDGGHDRIVGGSNLDFIYGGSGHDSLYGGAGGDYLRGDDGHDLLYGQDATDFLWGGSGDDILRGGDGHDMLYGDGGDDQLFGDSGNDVLRGGSGNDRLYGGTGWDQLYGESGNDLLDGGADSTSDYLCGGADYDTIVQHLNWSLALELESLGDAPEAAMIVDPYWYLGSANLLGSFI